MNLDDLDYIKKIDAADMLAEINSLPGQLEDAWEAGQKLQLPEMSGVRQVLIAGMGGSAISADLFTAYAEPLCAVPVVVQRDYTLPAWAKGPETLVVASSHSGNTEETLAVFGQAVQAGCRVLAITTGGQLKEAAEGAGCPVWEFYHTGQPRAAVGFSFGLLMALFSRLGLIPEPQEELSEALLAMRDQQTRLKAEVMVVNNPAKRLAGQIMNRWITVVGSGLLAPVARRWKGQINELAKSWAHFESLPEMNHNTLAGIENPEQLLAHSKVLFLQSPSDHPRNSRRSELTRQGFMLAGIGTDFYIAAGKTRLAHMWTALHFGDYVAYYLAMIYGVDPTPVPAIEGLKQALKS